MNYFFNVFVEVKTHGISIFSFNKAKKSIQGTDTAWKMLIINKAPLKAARSKSRLDAG